MSEQKHPPEGDPNRHYVRWFRQASPYINAHRGRTFVIVFGGEAVEDACFAELIADIALLNSLGVRLVLVHGSRHQIDAALESESNSNLAQTPSSHTHSGQIIDALRVTDDRALAAVKSAVGELRIEIEALLSTGIANSPMAGANIHVASGNLVVAKPIGIRDGIDYQHTGEVRRIEADAIRHHLDRGAIVLLSNIGYSPTGEVFNLSAEHVATEAAVALRADKLLSLVEGEGLTSERRLERMLSPGEAERLLASRNDWHPDLKRRAGAAIQACRRGVGRAHLISRKRDGALLVELFTRDGIGTLITEERYETYRTGNIDDVGGILALIKPLEDAGVLVKRSREQIELEIDRFMVIDRDGAIIGCAALHQLSGHAAELACLTIADDYRGSDRGDELLRRTEALALREGLTELFVLTTQSAHWFAERGFTEVDPGALPTSRQKSYNPARNSKVLKIELI